MRFEFTQTTLAGSFLVKAMPIGDSRGWFARTYCREEFMEIGHHADWVQMNHSFTNKKGSIRGMHYQLPPFEEIKLVRCIAGTVLDVIIDLRKDSATYLHHFSAELSETNFQMMYIPRGFAHGFQTLTDNCQLLYMHSACYTPGSEGGIRYNDPSVGIQWPLPVADISERDRNHTLIDSTFKAL